ncbi:MAG: hypothetical protein HDS14_08365 [Bacteroides sp.]|nr:hypothetical protein [Bacteroides sp.]
MNEIDNDSQSLFIGLGLRISEEEEEFYRKTLREVKVFMERMCENGVQPMDWEDRKSIYE